MNGPLGEVISDNFVTPIGLAVRQGLRAKLSLSGEFGRGGETILNSWDPRADRFAHSTTLR